MDNTKKRRLGLKLKGSRNHGLVTSPSGVALSTKVGSMTSRADRISTSRGADEAVEGEKRVLKKGGSSALLVKLGDIDEIREMIQSIKKA